MEEQKQYAVSTQPSVLEKIKHILGLDRAIAFTVLARGWSTMAGVVNILLIAHFLTASEQGYYYTFASLVALQIVFELGLSFVILQLAAHERAFLQIHEDGSITGDAVARSRLASVFHKAVRWYAAGAVLMAIVILPVGFFFFYTHSQPGAPVAWKLPWAAAVLATVATFQMDPIFSFLEGCGRIAEVARMRLTQAVVGSLMAWAALGLHHGLFAPAMVIGGQALAGGYFLFGQRRLLRFLARHDPQDNTVSWRGEIWPFQWRIAVSWLCGYFIFQLFNPVLFAYRGAVEAGRMGMSLNVASALTGVAVAWVNTKASPFGTLIARREFRMLDRLFFRTLWQSSMILVVCSGAVFAGLVAVTHLHSYYAGRVLPMPLFAVLIVTVLCNHIVFSEAIYLRAHKREPFLPLSVAVGISTACGTLLLGKWWGAAGVTVGYFFTSGVLGVSMGTWIFLRKRSRWHHDLPTVIAEAPTGESDRGTATHQEPSHACE